VVTGFDNPLTCITCIRCKHILRLLGEVHVAAIDSPIGDVAADAEVRRLTTAGREEIKPGQSVAVVGAPEGGPAHARTVVTTTAA
jgi:hypothetical protein